MLLLLFSVPYLRSQTSCCFGNRTNLRLLELVSLSCLPCHVQLLLGGLRRELRERAPRPAFIKTPKRRTFCHFVHFSVGNFFKRAKLKSKEGQARTEVAGCQAVSSIDRDRWYSRIARRESAKREELARSKEVLLLRKVPFPGCSNLFYLFGPGQAEQFLLSTIDLLFLRF